MRRRLQELKGTRAFDEDRAHRADPPALAPRAEAPLDPGSEEPPLDAEELPVHALPEPVARRRGALSLSLFVHGLVLALVFLARRAAPEAPTTASPLMIALQDPELEAPSAIEPFSPPREARSPPSEPERPAAGESRAKPVPPPPIPREIPPPTPLPPPTRMGEAVPIPHLPAPGTVPPEEGRSGRPGPPAPEPEDRNLAGATDGTSETDPGAGGPGRGGIAGGGSAAEPGAGIIRGGSRGGLEVPRPGGAGPAQGPGSGTGGRRRGLNLSVPDSGAFGDFSFDDKDYDWSDYHSQMYWAIWRAWHNRLYVMIPVFERWSFQKGGAGLKGSVVIHFVIERSGGVSSIEVLEPSSMSPLDDSAQGALKEVILPRLPSDFPKDREGVTARFYMEGTDVDSFRSGLRYMKYKGIF